ncbi:hypothetical protein NE865_05474 [Phthorimaea operculella]|nr:hypothetical protein NE865_05474 [Phthorimaea operculella]
MFQSLLVLCATFTLGLCYVEYKTNPAPDGHRCGVCPTYFQKVCAFNLQNNATFIFDNHCIMDIYNCVKGTEYQPMTYENCLYFGNFAYVHGYKKEDEDYGEDHLTVYAAAKNPPYR